MKTKRIFSAFIVAAFVLGALAFANPAQAVMRHYSADVTKLINTKTVASPILNTITYKVLAVGSNSAETIYSDAQRTAMTNPVTAAIFGGKDRIDFYCDPTDATNDIAVDLIVTDTNGGYTAFIEDFTPSIHLVEIDQRPNIQHHGVIWFGASSAVATSTGVVFLPQSAVEDMAVEVVTVDSTKTLSVGTPALSTGFRSNVLMTTAGFVADTGFITDGASIDYIPASNYGSLLTTAITGSNAVTTVGGNSKKWFFVSGGTTGLYYTGSTGSTTAAGYIHYFFCRLR